MFSRRKLVRHVAFLAITSIAATTALAQSGTWDTTDSGNWSDPTNWLGGTVAGGAGNTATFPTISGGSTTVTLDTTVTIGGVEFDWTSSSPNINRAYTFAGVNPLTFDNNGAGASIVFGEWFRGTPTFEAPVVLADNLLIDATQQSASNFTTTMTFGDVDVGGFNFAVLSNAQTRNPTINGVLSGDGSLSVTSLGTRITSLTLANPDNTFSGTVNLQSTGSAINAILSLSGGPDVLGSISQINMNNGQLQVTNFNADWTLPSDLTLNIVANRGAVPTGLTIAGDNQLVGAGQIATVGGGARVLRVEGSNAGLLGGVFLNFGSVEAVLADSFGSGPIDISATSNFGRNAYRALHAVDQSVVDRFTATSRGILALGLDTSVDLDFSALPNLQLGSAVEGGINDAGVVFSGNLTPGSNGYLLGGVGKITFASDLAGAHDVRVGKDGVGGLTVLSAANTFTGTLTVEVNGAVYLANANAAQNASAVITSTSNPLNTGAIPTLLLDPSLTYAGAAMAAIQLDAGAIGWVDDIVLDALPGVYTSRLVNIGGNKRVLHLGGAGSQGTMTQDAAWNIADDGATPVHLIKSGVDSVLDLSNVTANSFSGGMTILQGKVIFSDPDQLGTAAANRVSVRGTGTLSLAAESGNVEMAGDLITLATQGNLYGDDLSSPTIEVGAGSSITIDGMNAFANVSRNRLVKAGEGTLTITTDDLVTNQLSMVLTVAEGTLEMNQQAYRNNSIFTGHLAISAADGKSATYRLLAPPSDPTVLANYQNNYGFQGIRFVGAGTNVVDVDEDAVLRVHAGGAMANSQISWGAGTAVKTGLGTLEIAKPDTAVSIDVAPGAVFQIAEGTVARTGVGAQIFTDNFTANLGTKVSVDVQAAGTLAIGLGTLDVENYTQTGTLRTTWAGTGANEFGTLVAKNATLGGILDLDVTYMPAVGATPGQLGDTVTILTSANPISGTFSEVTGRILDPVTGQFARVVYNTNSVEVGAVQAIAGDANLDGVVDDADLAVLQANLGSAGTIWIDGDFTSQGTVSLYDAYLLFQNYTPASATSIPTPIPEPASLALLALGGVALLRRH